MAVRTHRPGRVRLLPALSASGVFRRPLSSLPPGYPAPISGSSISGGSSPCFKHRIGAFQEVASATAGAGSAANQARSRSSQCCLRAATAAWLTGSGGDSVLLHLHSRPSRRAPAGSPHPPTLTPTPRPVTLKG